MVQGYVWNIFLTLFFTKKKPNDVSMFSGLYFIVYGKAETQWTKVKNRKRNEIIRFEGRHVYLNTKSYVFGSPESNAVEMASGTYKYDFACPLLMLIPASFEGKHGHIRYHVEAVLDIPWRFNKEIKLQLTIARQDDLNEFPDLKTPVVFKTIEKYSCLCFNSQHLMVTVTLPQSGYAPGQKIHVTVSYDNKSNVRVNRTVVCLKRTVQFNW
jgi:hypothetical protein